MTRLRDQLPIDWVSLTEPEEPNRADVVWSSEPHILPEYTKIRGLLPNVKLGAETTIGEHDTLEAAQEAVWGLLKEEYARLRAGVRRCL